MSYEILAINPGSTSTKIGVYKDGNEILEETIRHSVEEIEKCGTILNQLDFREKVILEVLEKKKYNIKNLSAVVGRGGLLRPIEGGTYKVNEKMLEELRQGLQGHHACNLGAILADGIAKLLNIEAFIVDPGVVDELNDLARVSGLPEIRRKSIFHALNQKAVGKRYARDIGKKYEDLNLIIAHLGGGISVGAHENGRVVDVNNAFDGEGPFSPERSGSLPVGELIKLCYSGKYTLEELKKRITGKGGFVAYVGTNDVKEVYKMALSGDKKCKLLLDAMAYQIAKEIGRASVVLCGKVDAVIITGGIAYNEDIQRFIKKMVGFIAPFVVYPGEDELLALAQGGLRVLKGEEIAKEY
ncbi:butyrate kinase [Haloimpatiens sp. FM7315]|uniref:butyrate kinase n=1 Tax=Haloimpatiens sp. FM7315 TaxID=3298609 RepID=UPI0035A2BF3D